MNIDERQRARRAADQRRPFCRSGMWACWGGGIFAAWCGGIFDHMGLGFGSLISAVLIIILAAYALRFDEESRRIY